MLFKRFYDDQLAQASYMLACEAAGEALIVDPNRDVDFYIREAARERLRIAYVTETHIHADFVSGSRELARAATAKLLLSDEGGADWRYPFAVESHATLLRDGTTISFGKVSVTALHTPGHTPEHMAFLVTDRGVSDRPLGLLSGDFIFVGDVGRPDLLEKAANQAGTMETAARTLFASLAHMRSFPDYLQIWPGHGAGSACGKALGAMPQTTLGYERLSNWALQIDDEDAFVREVLHDQPSPPRYFAVMKRMNRDGPAILGGILPPAELEFGRFVHFAEAGGLIIDTRAANSFSREHIAGTVSIPLNRSFTKWAGSIIPYDREFCFIVDAAQRDSAALAARSTMLIGLDRACGFITSDCIDKWKAEGRVVSAGDRISVAEAAPLVHAGSVYVLDVRDPHEMHAGHIPGARNIPLSVLADRLAEVPRNKPVVVHCQSGGRSAIAMSMLRANGHQDVANLVDGITGWERAGLATETEAGETASRQG